MSYNNAHLRLLVLIISLVLATPSYGQTKPKQDKAPTQKEMEDMMKEAQKMMDEMSPEDKRMMDSLGIKIPSLKDIPQVSDQQLAEAWENENLIVPKRDVARIAAIPKGLTTSRMASYITTVQTKAAAQLKPEIKILAEEILSYIKSMSKNTSEAGNMAIAFWFSGQPDIALYALGQICALEPSNTDNLSNYASMLSMQGGQHLAIPILNYLNAKFPKNSTLLNNLGQAWFGLGELTKAEKYIDSTLVILPYHSQANMTKGAIEESKGNIEKARESVKKSIKNAYTKEKEEKLNKLGYKLIRADLRLPFRPGSDPIGLGNIHRPEYPTNIDELQALYPLWQQFNEACDAKIKKLQKDLIEANQKYTKHLNTLPSKALTSISNGVIPSFAQEPIFSRKAGLQLNEIKDHYERKNKSLASLHMSFSNDIESIREHRIHPNGEDCEAHKNAVSDLLKKLNNRKKKHDNELLTFHYQFMNDMAYWSQFTSTDELMFELIKLEFQISWLQKNRELQPLDMSTYYGVYDNCEAKVEAEPGKLAEFDDIACNYKSSIDFVIVSHETKCSHSTTTYNLGKIKYTERELGNKYMGSTLKLSTTIAGIEGKAGPLTAGASIGADVTIELDENNDVKDWSGTVKGGVEAGVGIKAGPIKAGASAGNAIEVEFGPSGVGDINMVTTLEAGAGALGQKIEIGIESRTSLISGHGSTNGLGMLSGTTFSQW